MQKKLEQKLEPSSKLVGKAFELSKFWKSLSGLKLPIVIIGVFAMLFFYFPLTTILILFAVVLGERLLSKRLGVGSFALSTIILLPLLLIIWGVLLIIKKLATNWYLRKGALTKKKP